MYVIELTTYSKQKQVGNTDIIVDYAILCC